MRFSVITPCLNRADLLGATIESVLAQEYNDFEHWIIDGGSTDGTLDVLKRYADLRIVSEPDRGLYDAINKGIRLATGDVIVILNSDDLLVPGAFTISAEIFQHTVGTMIVSGGCQIFRNTPEGTEIEMHRYSDPREYALSLRNVTIGKPNLNARFFRRKVFAEIGEFHLAYPMSADRDFLIRVALRRLPDAPVAKVLYRYRWHAGSLTMNSGNTTLLAAMKENERIAQFYSGFSGLSASDLRNLRTLGKRSGATALMILALRGAWGEFCRDLVAKIVSDPSFVFVLSRAGTAAIFRRLRIWVTLQRNR
ncbi:MAG: glycosyltransferase [Verrucomicrobia bacterium]|nr:glycosyltransferase [Verrucomicrobiota bacterium]